MDAIKDEDRRFMQLAFRLARLALGYPAPNPPVGAVVVKHGHILGTGYHFLAGTPHAEQWALRQAGKAARDATLYVTLEPCNHMGRTPPCTLAILKAGIRRLVFSVNDPNPNVTGGGAHRLKEAGLEVIGGVMEEDGRRLLAGFIESLQSQKPYTILKVALTLDGRVGSREHRVMISSPRTFGLVQELRATCDAVLVGSGTVLIDRPALVPRTRFLHPGKNFYRCVLDTRLKTPMDAPCYDERTPVVIFHANDVRPGPEWHRPHRTFVPLRQTQDGLDLAEALHWMGDHDIQRCLVECGPNLFRSFLNHPELINELWILHHPAFGYERIPLSLVENFIPDSSISWDILDRWHFGEDLIWRLAPSPHH